MLPSVRRERTAMAMWYDTEIEFTNRRPTDDEAKALHDVLLAVDYDAPQVTTEGLRSTWRSPDLSVEEVCDILHFCGFPCRGRSRRNYDRPSAFGDWHASTAKLPSADFWREEVAIAVFRAGLAIIVPKSHERGES